MISAPRAALVGALTLCLAFGELALECATAPSSHTAEARSKRKRKKTPVRIECDVDGADVYIDGDLVGTTPLPRSVRVTPGERVVRVVKRGYADFYETIKIPRSRRTFTVTAGLIPVAGILLLESIPTGAGVTLDGVYLGDTPFDGDINEGAQTLLLVLPGYKNKELQIDVIGGETYELEIVLDALPKVDPFYTKWWFWTGVVAVTTGTVLAIVFATSDDSPPPRTNPVVRLPLGSW